MAYSVAPGSAVHFGNKVLQERTVLSEEQLEVIGKDGLRAMERDGFVVYFNEQLSAPPTDEELKFKGKWYLDPVELQGWTLENLNLKVKEIDPDVEPFETSEEAIAQLTADFQK